MALSRYLPFDARPVLGARTGAFLVFLAMAALWSLDLRTVLSSRRVADWMGPPHSAMDFAPVVSGAVCVVLVLLVLWPPRGHWTTFVAGAAVPLVVITTSVLLWPLPKGTFGYPIVASEGVGMVVAASLVALRGRVWQMPVVATLVFLAVCSDYLREPYVLDAENALLVAVLGLAPGLYLRWRAVDRDARVRRIRAEERLAIARDLHDVVAHEVTGIVVRVQALRHVADRRPEMVREALPEIEEAGGRALESMRGMVSRLRGPEEAPLAPDPAEGLAALAAPASPGRPEVSVHADVNADVADLPVEVGTAILRIAQESVTNALRYARGAERITVVVESDGDTVLLRISDDGRGGARTGGLSGGGHGLVGMAERARILGGTLSAGPDGFGQGWTVRAEIPVSGERERTR